MSTSTRETTIAADPDVPAVVITREFAAPVAHVFRAHVEPDLLTRWLGPREMTTQIDHLDARTGGAYRYVHDDGRGGEYAFFGSFHEIRRDERIVQTFGFEGFPDSVALETLTFTALDDGRTRLHCVSLFDSAESRDGMLEADMETGVREGYEQLDDLLAAVATG